MDATLNLRGHQDATNRLLRHCLSLGTAEGRIPARLRLEEAIGAELDAPARHEPDCPQPAPRARSLTGTSLRAYGRTGRSGTR